MGGKRGRSPGSMIPGTRRQQAFTEGKARKATNDGYRIGLMVASAVLNDKYDFTDDELRDFIIYCDQLMYSMTNDMDSWRDIERALMQITGLQLFQRNGEKPDDGRFAIVDKRLAEMEEKDG